MTPARSASDASGALIALTGIRGIRTQKKVVCRGPRRDVLMPLRALEVFGRNRAMRDMRHAHRVLMPLRALEVFGRDDRDVIVVTVSES